MLLAELHTDGQPEVCEGTLDPRLRLTGSLLKQLHLQPEVEEPDVQFIFCHFQGFGYERNRLSTSDAAEFELEEEQEKSKL